MNRSRVENEARRLQYEIWHKRKLLWPLGEPSLQGMFAPRVAAHVLNVEYELRDKIASSGFKHGFEAAGILNRTRGLISISTRFKYPVQHFTGAHEIGHFVLHPDVGSRTEHRDRPIFDIPPNGRSLIELEADYFAACFLAPRKLVEEAFTCRFGSRNPLRLDETVAFHLCGNSAHELFVSPTGSLKFAAAVAGAQKFDRLPFQSLADHFGISISAMAIRLRELALVVD